MTNYIYPVNPHPIQDFDSTFAGHVARGSVNPGTDYAVAMGTSVVSVASGVVTDADGAPDGSGGRTVHVDHDDGSGADYLHLNAISVSAGDRVSQGQRVGFSGASGEGINNYYGPHLHISFRYNHSHGYWNDGNVDFDAIMTAQTAAAGGGAVPIPEEVPEVVAKYIRQDRVTRILAPGVAAYLRDANKNTWNVVGGVGDNYQISVLFRAEGFAPGDSVKVYLQRQNGSDQSFGHFVNGVAGSDGVIAVSMSDALSIKSGDAYFVYVVASAANKNSGSIIWIDAISYMFS